MIRRTLRTGAVSLALVLLLMALVVPTASARGKPTRVAITQAACGSFTIEASWWKQLDVRAVRFDYSLNGTLQSSTFLADAAGITNPWSYSLAQLGFAFPTTTYSIVVALYGDTAGQTRVATGTATTTVNC